MKTIALLLLFQYTIMNPFSTEVPTNDHRTPVVSVPITPSDRESLDAAVRRLDAAQQAVLVAQRDLDDARAMVVKRHRTKDLTEQTFCGTAGYAGAIVRDFVVYTLQTTECRAL